MSNIDRQKLGKLFYKKIINISKEEDVKEQIHLYLQSISQLYFWATEDERLKFAHFNSRIAFTGHKFKIPKDYLHLVYTFRKEYFNYLKNQNQSKNKETSLLNHGKAALAYSVKAMTDCEIPIKLQKELIPIQHFLPEQSIIQSHKEWATVLLIDIDKENEYLIAVDNDAPQKEIKIKYNIVGKNDFFNPSIALIEEVFGFPIQVNLLDVDIDDDEMYRPSGFVILPDYLIDITSISECFNYDGSDARLYLLKKFIPVHINKYLVIGNTANYFLDEMMKNTSKKFKELFLDIFKHDPIGLSTLDDREIREIMMQCQRHYVHLLDTIHNDFKNQQIDAQNAYLEPSFYSRIYGIQGRLDLWYQSEKTAKIVELKSGKPFRPNKEGLNINHYIQTLLYDLLVKSVFGQEINPTNYILYSQVEQNRLRFAKVSITHQMEAMQIRNQIMAIEFQMTQMNAESSGPLELIMMDKLEKWQGFHKRDAQHFNAIYKEISLLNKKYIHTLCGFIAREHYTAKISGSHERSRGGQASLWSKSLFEKQEDFEILSPLKIHEINKGEEPIIYFVKTEKTNDLANFRVGDIVVMYPFVNEESTVLKHQIFKCTIIEMNSEYIAIRLRAKQHHYAIFEEFEYWNLEHDLYDSSFNTQYKQLLSFAAAPQEKRDLILGVQAPSMPDNTPSFITKEMMTNHQEKVFNQVIHQGNMFLLWGPPGTGKTNMMVQQIVGHCLDKTDEHLLLLTYTNRAADEICAAIESYAPHIRDNYFRIGSRFSIDNRFKDRLLNELIANVNTRKEVKEIIQKNRIVVATVASMLGQKQLLQLKTFDRVIIDEASQITESMLCGLLPYFEKVLMIGDHKQLPAVTTQSEQEALVHDEELNAIGLTDLRRSLFERLFQLYQEKNYDYAFAQLYEQGRMHQDIMSFPDRQFYNNSLSILPNDIPYSKEQKNPLQIKDKRLGKQRILFIPTDSKAPVFQEKTNKIEAQIIVDLVKRFQKIYPKMPLGNIGIITPFRAQIACIMQSLQEAKVDVDSLTIDTVERYQGGARDVILISVCANHPLQLRSIVSADKDNTIDRKLNVAITRARKHLVMVGNPEVLKENLFYREFMKEYGL